MKWVLAMGLVLLLLLPWGSRADPSITTTSSTEGLALWTFYNPFSYATDNSSLGGAGASLAWSSVVAADTSAADFAQASPRVNIDLVGSPGDVAILNTSQQSPLQSFMYKPTPGELEDNYLYSGGGANTNFGSSPTLQVGYLGNPDWSRAILRFPNLPLPSNATLVTAHLQLYMHTADTVGPLNVSVHRMTTSWTELGATWNDYDGSNPWNTSGGGGDFDPAAVDMVRGITTVQGWYTWNITTLARGWWTGTVPNQGLLVRQAYDDLKSLMGKKQFNSSDSASSAFRPRLLLNYTTPSSVGTLESRVWGTGTVSRWQNIWWNSSLPWGTSVTVQTRTGASPSIDATWSPWSAPYAASGVSISSPPAGYLQYRVRLFTPSSSSPVLHDVATVFGHFSTQGSIQTQALSPASLVGWGRLELNWTGPLGTRVNVSYSQTNGSSWLAATAGQNLTDALAKPIILRLSLGTNYTINTPLVRAFSLGFQVTPSGGGGGNAGTGGLPWWLALVLAGLLVAGLIARRLLRKPFRPTDLFLIHGDGRLVLRVGVQDSPMQDEHAVSAMFTVVANFVEDSFRGSDRMSGGLKSFQVGEREVVIAKGEYLFLALLGEGPRPPQTEAIMVDYVRGLEAEHRSILEAWNGFGEGLGPLKVQLRWFLERGYRRARGGPHGDFDRG